MKIDLNCDMGESFGVYQLGNDEAIMSYISSANIACGFHAGDPHVMKHTVNLAVRANVAIGAHPGYPDLQGFGRREMALKPDEIFNIVLYQISALDGIARAAGTQLHHVKPHGALYNQASDNLEIAMPIARALLIFNPQITLVGLAGSKLIEAGNLIGLTTASEGFPDRAYLPDGSLMPRNQSGSVLHDPEQVAEHAVQLALEGIRLEREGVVTFQKVDTLCLHGDNPSAVANAQLVSKRLKQAGFEIIHL